MYLFLQLQNNVHFNIYSNNLSLTSRRPNPQFYKGPLYEVLYLITLVLKFINGCIGAVGRLKVDKSISFASVSRLVKDSLGRTYRSKSKKRKNNYLHC